MYEFFAVLGLERHTQSFYMYIICNAKKRNIFIEVFLCCGDTIYVDNKILLDSVFPAQKIQHGLYIITVCVCSKF